MRGLPTCIWVWSSSSGRRNIDAWGRLARRGLKKRKKKGVVITPRTCQAQLARWGVMEKGTPPAAQEGAMVCISMATAVMMGSFPCRCKETSWAARHWFG
jgi:hypothetical protein